VIEVASGVIAGSSHYQGLENADGGSAEIGWTFLARRLWGGSCNLELKRLMVAHALARIAECRFALGEDNWRSRKAMEKIGARLSARKDLRAMAGGTARHVHYIIGYAEFASGPVGQG
jgi:RimJ/RimL family protein N-acetyltransferase